MLIVYRHELKLTAGAVAGLFLVYALTLIPGLLVGGPASDRFGRRPLVWPFVALSPLATLLLVLGPRSLAMLAAGRALAGLCSGVVFGAATAWVQEVSPGEGTSARRSALALTAGFGLGPVVAALLAQWAPSPLVTPYLPHLVIGVAAAATLGRIPADAPAPGGTREPQNPLARRRWPPAAVRTARFWLVVAPASPMVFGSVALAIAVLPEEVTSAGSLSAGFAGLMTALSFAAGVAVQPFARRLRDPLTGAVAGLTCTVAGTGVGIAAVAGPDRVLAGAAAVLLGLAYGLCLVSGLRQAERLAAPDERGAVVACYYALAYLGFAAPYLAAGLSAAAGKAGAFTALTAIIAGLTLWTAGYAARLRRTARQAEADSAAGGSAQAGNSVRGQVTHHPVRHNLKDFRAERGHLPALLPAPASLAPPDPDVTGDSSAFHSGPLRSTIKVVFRFSAKR
jgi:predicted MFS family arabinose efflux permease